jgi:hypothetical protein
MRHKGTQGSEEARGCMSYICNPQPTNETLPGASGDPTAEHTLSSPLLGPEGCLSVRIELAVLCASFMKQLEASAREGQNLHGATMLPRS